MYATLLKYLMMIIINLMEDNEMSFVIILLNLEESGK